MNKGYSFSSFSKVVCRELGLGFAQSGTQTNYFNSNSTIEEIISGKFLNPPLDGDQ